MNGWTTEDLKSDKAHQHGNAPDEELVLLGEAKGVAGAQVPLRVGHRVHGLLRGTTRPLLDVLLVVLVKGGAKGVQGCCKVERLQAITARLIPSSKALGTDCVAKRFNTSHHRLSWKRSTASSKALARLLCGDIQHRLAKGVPTTRRAGNAEHSPCECTATER